MYVDNDYHYDYFFSMCFDCFWFSDEYNSANLKKLFFLYFDAQIFITLMYWFRVVFFIQIFLSSIIDVLIILSKISLTHISENL